MTITNVDMEEETLPAPSKRGIVERAERLLAETNDFLDGSRGFTNYARELMEAFDADEITAPPAVQTPPSKEHCLCF